MTGKASITILTIAVSAFLFHSGLHAQQGGWQGEERLTYDDETAFAPPNNGKYVAYDDQGKVHVVWTDDRDRNFEIYHKYKESGIWSADTRLTFDNAYSARPVIVSGRFGLIHLVWNDSRDGNKEIYHKVYFLGGWGGDTRVTDTAGDSFASSIAIDGNTLHLVYQEDVSGFTEIMYRTYSGAIWSEAFPLTSVGAGHRMVPTIAIGYDHSIHVAWWDTRPDTSGSTDGQIYYRVKTTDWSEEELVSNPDGDAMRPNIAIDDDGGVHVVWIDKRDPFDQIYFREKGTGGWEPEVALTSGNYVHYHPSIATVGTDLFVAYWDNHISDTNSEVFVRNRTSGVWSGTARISDGIGPSTLCCLVAEPTGNLHVAWIDGRDGNDELYYRAYIDPSTSTGEEEETPEEENLPIPFSMSVRPNPFIDSASIELSLPASGYAEIMIFDAAGRCIKRLSYNGYGRETVRLLWDGTDMGGEKVAPGVYLALARFGKMRLSTKILHVR